MATMIVTHTSPDWDAIASCWLLQRYGGLADAGVRFVNTGNPDPGLLAEATAVVDTGRVADFGRLRFDHHHLTGAEARTSAATQVYGYVASFVDQDMLPGPVSHLIPLVGLVNAGDIGDSHADPSRAYGIHALLSAQKARRLSDEALLAWGYEVLDLIDERLRAEMKARLTLSQHVAYRSEDGLIVALHNAPQAATQAAFEAGARLVVFHSEYPDVPTVAVGIQRAPQHDFPHVGEILRVATSASADPRTLVQGIALASLHNTHDPAREQAIDEMKTWFQHPAGFFAGRGTPKAPDARPLECSIAEIAQAVDAAWVR